MKWREPNSGPGGGAARAGRRRAGASRPAQRLLLASGLGQSRGMVAWAGGRRDRRAAAAAARGDRPVSQPRDRPGQPRPDERERAEADRGRADRGPDQRPARGGAGAAAGPVLPRRFAGAVWSGFRAAAGSGQPDRRRRGTQASASLAAATPPAQPASPAPQPKLRPPSRRPRRPQRLRRSQACRARRSDRRPERPRRPPAPEPARRPHCPPLRPRRPRSRASPRRPPVPPPRPAPVAPPAPAPAAARPGRPSPSRSRLDQHNCRPAGRRRSGAWRPGEARAHRRYRLWRGKLLRSGSAVVGPLPRPEPRSGDGQRADGGRRARLVAADRRRSRRSRRPRASGKLKTCFRSQDTTMTDEFHRIRRLPPYVFAEVNRRRRSRARRATTSSISAWAIPTCPTPPHIVDKLVEAVAGPRTHRYSASQGHSRPAPGPGQLLPPPLRRDAGPRDRGDRDAGLEGGLRQPRRRPITAPGDVILVPNPAYPIHPFGFIIAAASVRHVPARAGRGVCCVRSTAPCATRRRRRPR